MRISGHQVKGLVPAGQLRSSVSRAAAPLSSSFRALPPAFPVAAPLPSRGTRPAGFAIAASLRSIFSMGQRQSYKLEVPEDKKWWNGSTVAVVTGANKGIGYEIARNFADQGLKTVVAARNEELGRAAVDKIKESTGSDNVVYHQLDISNPASVNAFAKWAENDLKRVSVLVNNAGFAHKGDTFGADEAQTVLDVNYFGTKAVCEALKPLLSPDARVVNVCSSSGQLAILKSPVLRAKFEDARSADEVTTLARKFVDDIRAGRHKEEGWPSSMYGVSKLCEATYTRILAEELKGSGATVTACCPGYVSTDMSSHRGTKTPPEGADTPTWLALLADKSASGRNFADRREKSF
ncbi:hypothetical protein WJX72_000441 [[Myrmecia] bisecta]|uniref:Uncharacterized protein n=1 Tax=[Myrmecia] bisecta TaxID=41462 RepID=A0AAW1Q2D9_9CHLO